jgi:hypothetical protein
MAALASEETAILGSAAPTIVSRKLSGWSVARLQITATDELPCQHRYLQD